MVGGITVWLVENSYTTVSSHSVSVSIFELRVVVVEEYNCLVRLSMRYCICREDMVVIALVQVL